MHIVSISGFAEVDKLFGRPVKFTRDDFIPIARFIADPMVIVVNDRQPYKTLKELVDDAKKRPNQLVFSSSGLYGALHLPTALFMRAAGIQMKHLPTAGGGPALTAILGNNSQVLVSSIAAANAQMKAGKLRPLACFGAKRAPALPEVPTMKELGYDVEFYLWVGLFAPKNTPEQVISVLRNASKKAASAEAFHAAMKNVGQDVAYLDQPEFKKFWDADAKRVEDAVRQIGKVEG
jgi:tripartite-type tricarboxylate transporter receptor subunit TctC